MGCEWCQKNYRLSHTHSPEHQCPIKLLGPRHIAYYLMSILFFYLKGTLG